MKKLIAQLTIALLLTTISSTLSAQYKFVIEGKLKIQSGNVEGSTMEIFQNGSLIKKKALSRSGKFEYELDFNRNYIITFKKDGYVTKKMSFETKAPDDRIRNGFYPFEFQITLFKQYEGINTVIFNQPVGQIMFDPELGDFDYDKDYTQSMLSQMEEIENQINEREKEEEKLAEEKGKKEKDEKIAKNDEKEEDEEETEAVKEEVKEKQIPKPIAVMVKPTKKTEYTQTRKKLEGKKIVLQAYTAGEHKFPNLNAYGYINFGDGGGIREISKEEFDKYALQYR